MKDNLNDKFLAVIKEYIPEDKKVLNYLIQQFGLSKEASYRRVNRIVPFTVDEIIYIAGDLGFSVDDIIGHPQRHIPYSLGKNMLIKADARYLETYRFFINNIRLMTEAKKKQTIILGNQFSEFLNFNSDVLFRFFYLRHLHQINSVLPDQPFADVSIPEEIVNVYEEFKKYYAISGNDHHFEMIIDDNYYKFTMNQVVYFYKRKFLSQDEFKSIKDELIKTIIWFRGVAQNGGDEYGFKYSLFLSSSNIDSNFTYYEYDNTVCSLYWVYPVNPIVIYDKEICAVQKKWIQSYKKYSILISESNEMLQSNFFDKQIEYIESLYNINR